VHRALDSQSSYYAYLAKRNKLSLLVRSFFVKDLARHFSGSVLDVGCGIGEFLGLYDGKSVGLDLNPYLVKHCAGQGGTCCLGLAQGLPFQSDSFDGVLASNVLEHLDDVEAVVADIVRVLKAGGVLVVTVPMDAGFRHDPTHVRMLRKADLQALARAWRLEVKRIYAYPFCMGWLGKCLYFCELRAVFVKK
jgi:SAM-dependent methyltransferase